MIIGILAIQGAFIEHAKMMARLHVNTKWVKSVSDLEGIDGIILPGGESTAMSKQMQENGLLEALSLKIKAGLPTMGTCAGLILMAKSIEKDALPTIKAMDIHVKRNAYGRQLGSFKTTANIPAVSKAPIELVFIRAPYIDSADSSVEVLYAHENKVVAAKQNHMIALAFHPELTDNPCFHQFFIEEIKKKIHS